MTDTRWSGAAVVVGVTLSCFAVLELARLPQLFPLLNSSDLRFAGENPWETEAWSWVLHEDRFVPFLVLLGALGLVWLVAVLARADRGSDLALVTIFAVSVVVAWASFCRADFDRLAAGELLLFSSLLVVVWAVSAGGRGADVRAPTGRGTWLLVALVVGQVVTGGVDLVRGGEAAAPGVQLALGCLGLLAVAFAQPRVALKPAVALLVSGFVLFFPAWSSRHDRRWLEASGPHELTFFPPQHVRFAPMSRCAGTLERGPVVIVAEDEVRLGSLLMARTGDETLEAALSARLGDEGQPLTLVAEARTPLSTVVTLARVARAHGIGELTFVALSDEEAPLHGLLLHGMTVRHRHPCVATTFLADDGAPISSFPDWAVLVKAADAASSPLRLAAR